MLLKKCCYLSFLSVIAIFGWHCGTIKNSQPMTTTIAFEESRLMGTPWRLGAYQQNNSLHQVDSSLEVTIAFEHSKEEPATTRLYGRAACNRYFGGCTIAEGKLTINNNMGMTRMMCAPPEMEMEGLYIKLLPTMTKAEFVENEKTKKIDLILSNDNKEQLIFFAYNLE